VELADLIREEDARVRALQAEVRSLRGRLDRSRGGGVRTEEVRRLEAEIRDLSVRGGSAGLVGPGVMVVLDDSTAGRSPSGDPNDLVVHEQDIQTVVNALWAAGAEAVAVNGQRLTSASAVRCAGNTLLLHGAVYSPPYEIGAIGEPDGLRTGFPTQPGMSRLHDAVRTFGIRLSVSPGEVSVPGGAPVDTLQVAAPAA
jgi:uncharacterized protein YlxW (UPF0749 family)